MIRQPAGGADEAGHVDVVAAGVHHADLTPGLVASRRPCWRTAARSLRRPAARPCRCGPGRPARRRSSETPTTPSLPTFVVTSAPAFLSSSAIRFDGFDLLERQLGMGVQMRVQRDRAREAARRSRGRRRPVLSCRCVRASTRAGGAEGRRHGDQEDADCPPPSPATTRLRCIIRPRLPWLFDVSWSS